MCLREVLVGEIPVDQRPPSSYVLVTSVAIINVVSVLPNVAHEDGLARSIYRTDSEYMLCKRNLVRLITLEGVASIVSLVDLELAIMAKHEPSPAWISDVRSRITQILNKITRAEVGGRGIAEGLLEVFEIAKAVVNRVLDGAVRLTTTLGAQGVPVESVVPALSSVVEDTTLASLDELLEGLVLIGSTLDQTVELGEITSVMLSIVELDRLRRDVRLQGILSVGELRQSVRHFYKFFWCGQGTVQGEKTRRR
jgi:hypothetical protein